MCRITEYRDVRLQSLFSTQVLVNDILVGLEKILNYAGAGLEKFYCTKNRLNFKNLCKSFLECLANT